MAGLLEKMMHEAAKRVGKGYWVFRSLTGTGEEALRAELYFGYQISLELERDTPPDPDEALQAWITGIGKKLKARLRDQRRPYRFRVLSGGEPNALALPGGFIYITRSLIELCQRDEDEIAFVLGHEMGHVLREHVLDRYITDAGLRFLGNLAQVRSGGGAWARQALTRLVSTQYSRDQELDADVFGFRIARAAGYDPEGGVRFMRRLGRLKGDESGSWKRYFATHPGWEERSREIRRELKKKNPTQG